MNVVDSSKDFHMFFKEGNHYDTFYNLVEDPLLEDALGRQTGWGGVHLIPWCSFLYLEKKLIREL
jgi:hypothetical protein